MKSITYTISDPNGIHARPAGVMVRCARQFASGITVEKDGKRADCKKLFALMQLGVRGMDMITISAEGTDEDEAAETLYRTMRDMGL